MQKRFICGITAKNFRSLRNFHMTPDRVNLIVAPTGSGKSSIRGATEYAFTRRNHWTNGAGTGIATQVSHGTKSGNVIVYLKGSDNYELEVRAEFPKEGDANLKRATTLSTLGLSETLLRSLFRGASIVDESDATRREILCEALGIDVRIETLIRRLNEWHPDLPDLGNWLDQQTADLGWLGLNYEKFASEQRTAANRALKEARQRVEFLRQRVLDETGQENPPPRVSPDGIQDMQDRQEALIHRIATIEASEQPAQEAYQATLHEWEASRSRVREAADAMASAQASLDSARTAMPAKPEKYLPPDVLEGKLEKINARLAEIEAERSRLLDKQNAAISGPCPPGTCRAHETELALKQLQALGQDAQLHRDYQGRCQTAIRNATQYDTAVDVVTRRIQDAERTLEEATKRLHELPAPTTERPQPPASQQDILAELRQGLQQVRDDLTFLSGQQSAYETWEREYLEYGEASVRVEHIQDEASRWDAVVKALEPRGLAARLSEQAVQLWADQVDANTSKHFGMRFRIVFGDREWILEGKRDVQVDPSADWTPVSQMSDGERLLLSAVIQVAIVGCTSLPVVFLDGAQAADISRMKRLVKFLHASGVQAFLFATSQNQTLDGQFVKPKPIATEGVSAWWLESGQITKL